MKLRSKIVIITAVIVAIMGMLTVFSIQGVVSRSLKQQLQDKGLSLARVMANDLANPLLDGDLLVVQRILKAVTEDGHSVEYAFIIAPDGKTLIHTFGDGFPEALLTANPLPAGRAYSVQLLDTERGPIRDIGLKILDGLDSELHVGFSETSIQGSLHRVTWIIALLTLGGILLACGAAWLLGRHVARPLERLTSLTHSIGQGDLEQEITIETTDEVGILAQSFNQMIRNLRETIGRLKESEESYRLKNRELSAINAATKVIGLHTDIDQVLGETLNKLVEVMSLRGGWILIFADEGRRVVSLAASAGVPPGVLDRCNTIYSEECACWRVRRCARSGAEDLPRAACEILGAWPGAESSTIVGPIPLSAKARVLGFMNIVADRFHPVTASDLDILCAIGRQLGVAIENAQLWGRLKRREETVSRLLKKVITAQEEERKRIARELHDETNQSLAALAVGLKAASALVTRDAERAEKTLEDLKDSAVIIMQELHNIVYDLRPTLLDDHGLIPALKWCAETRLESQGVEVSMEVAGISSRLPAEVETILFRIGQEAISNIAKYAQARHVHLCLRGAEDQVLLDVSDDGCGFNVDEILREKEGKRCLGLIGMMERASLLGGKVGIESSFGLGTIISVQIPIASQGGELDGQDTRALGG
ncbi:MAG: histidine kinase [Actinobacteria bacterium]|nr:histidine kinase [Actinomycetota bacterium]